MSRNEQSMQRGERFDVAASRPSRSRSAGCLTRIVAIMYWVLRAETGLAVCRYIHEAASPLSTDGGRRKISRTRALAKLVGRRQKPPAAQKPRGASKTHHLNGMNHLGQNGAGWAGQTAPGATTRCRNGQDKKHLGPPGAKMGRAKTISCISFRQRLWKDHQGAENMDQGDPCD